MNKNFKKLIIITLLLFIIFNVYNYFARTVNGDEAILAEQAKELAINGHVSSPMFTGLGQGWEYSQLHYHKLFIWAGALIYKIFGTSLYALRFISLLSFVLLIFVVRKLIQNETENKLKLFIVSILLLSNYVIFCQGFIYRPEMLVSCFGVCSFYFINQGINQNSKKIILFASICAGLAALSHLNGLSVIFANVIILLWNKKLINAILSGFTSSFVILFYFIDINTKEKFIQFKAQFFSDPNFEEGTLGILSPFVKILGEHMRFFHDVYTISFSILFISILVLSFKYLKTFHKNLIVYLLFLVIGLAAISHGATVKYAILYYPFMSIIIVYGLFNLIKQNSRIKYIPIILIGMYLAINVGYSINSAINFENTVKRSEYIGKNMKLTQTNIFAPEYFYFNQDKNYKIRIPLAYRNRNNDYKQGQWTDSDFYNYNYDLNNFYILLDSCFISKELIKCSNYSSLKKDDTIFNYKVIYVEKEFKVLQCLKQRY